MSTLLTGTLVNLLRRQNEICCLCLNIIYKEPIHIEDDVAVNIDQEEQSLSVFNVVTSILGQEISDYLLTFEHVCTQCVLAAIQSYTFAKNCKLNSQLLTNTLNGLYDSFENVKKLPRDCQSLYVSLSTEDFTSKQFYDYDRPMCNISTAYQRFNTLVNTPQLTPKSKIEGSKSDKQIREKGKRLIPIRTADMILNKDDPVIKCAECLKVFPTRLSIRNHFIRVHAPKIYECPQCPKKFGSPAYLEAHNSESHSTFICSQCGKTFNSRHTFKLHEMGHYMRFVCPDCGRVYKSKATFKKHIELNVCGQKVRASPLDAKFTCDYCNKKYTQKMSLRVHIQYEHGNYKPHQCEHCDKKFWAISRLKAHMVKHTKERNFPCDRCNKKFVSKESLLYHTRIHTGEKPYECSHCNARFLSASRRSEHIKRQHTNATLECNICGSKFSSQNYLHKHNKSHINSVQSVTESGLNKTVPTQKVNASDLKKLTQDLKMMEENEDKKLKSKRNNSEQDDIKMDFFTSDNGEYIVHISTQ